MIEHIDHESTVFMLSECFRVLKPGGKIVIENRIHRRAGAMAAADKAGLHLESETNPIPSNFIAVFTYVSFHLAGAPYHFSSTLLGLIFVTYLAGTVIAPMTGWMVARLGRRRFILALIAAWAGGALLTLLPPIAAIIAGLTLCAGCGMLCQTVATG